MGAKRYCEHGEIETICQEQHTYAPYYSDLPGFLKSDWPIFLQMVRSYYEPDKPKNWSFDQLAKEEGVMD